jgi:hypothetical protein
MHGRALNAVRQNMAWQVDKAQQARQGGRVGRLWVKTDRPAVRQGSKLVVKTDRQSRQGSPTKLAEKAGG